MRRKVVAVDVDLTVVDSLTPWMDWLRQFSEEPVKNESRTYNLVPEMQDILDRAGFYDVDPLEYWRRTDLYDGLEIVDGALEALKRVKERGDDLVFVSSCFPEHEASKTKLLERHFSFADAFISTHAKHFVAYDVLIDDKLEHMRLGDLYRPLAKHILFTGIRADGTDYQRMRFTKMNRWDKLDRLLNPPYFGPAFA